MCENLTMSIRLGDWGSSGETETHLVCEGITQQPASFYNGNFSSSIWGNPPTPPLWREMPASSASHSRLDSSSFTKHTRESAIPCKIDTMNKNWDKVSRWAGDFPSGQQTGPQDSSSSPFSFGFPPPSPSPPSSSSSLHNHSTFDVSSYSQTHFNGQGANVNCQKKPVNKKFSEFDKGSRQRSSQERAYSLKELTNRWEAILQSQDAPPSIASQEPVHGSFPPASSAGLASPKEVRQHQDHTCGNASAKSDNDATFLYEQQSSGCGSDNPFANADMGATFFQNKQSRGQSSGNPFDTRAISPDKQQSSHPFTGIPGPTFMPPLSSQKCDAGTFIFGSRPAADNIAKHGLSQPKDFVFGSHCSSDVKNVGFSQQGHAHSSAAGSMSRSSVANSKVKKQNANGNRKNTTAPLNRSSQPGPSKPSFDMPGFGTSVFMFTMGASDADCSHFPDFGLNVDKANSGCGPASSLQNPQLFVQNGSLSNGTNEAGLQTPFAPDSCKRATEDTPSSGIWVEGKPVHEKSRAHYAQGIGEQFDTWHPFLQREDTSIKKCGVDGDHRPSSETNRTFEGSKLAEFDLNSAGKLSGEDLQEKATRFTRPGEEPKRQKENQEPNFVFGSHKTSSPFVFSASRTTKHATLKTDYMSKECRLKGTGRSKELEHLINKLGEKMANLGKSHDTQSNHAAYRGESVAEETKESIALSGLFFNKLPKESQAAADVVEKNIALNISIKELREHLAKLFSSDCQINKQSDKAGQVSSSFHGDRIAVEHSLNEICDQITKLDCCGGERNADTASKSKSFTSGAQQTGSCDSSAIKHAAEELREKIAKLGRALGGNNQDDYSASEAHQNGTNEKSVEELREKMATLGRTDEEEDNQRLKQGSTSRPNKSKNQEAFVFSACTTSKASDSTPFLWSTVYPGNGSGAGFSGTAQPNPFSTVPPSTFFPRTVLIGAQSLSSSPMVNPFMAGPAPSPLERHNGAKSSAFEMPSASNVVGEDVVGKSFEFHGTKGSPNRTTTERKKCRAFLNLQRREKESTRSKIHSTSTADSTGSPMDFSFCADKCPSWPTFGSNEAQAPVWKLPDSSLEEDESMHVEELQTATSNLTIGSRRGVDQKDFRSSEHVSKKANPFGLREKKGTWKRAPRNSSEQTDSKPQSMKTAQSSARAAEGEFAEEHTCSVSSAGFNLRSFSQPADHRSQAARLRPLRNPVCDQGSATSFANGNSENIETAFASTKVDQLFRSNKLSTNPKAALISRELPASPTATRTATSEQACENWRSRGNQAYAKGDYEKAEAFYSRGIGSVSSEDISHSCVRASMLCYSNRAATRMAVGRMREALEDSKRAMMLDSNFLRARIRAASCHLALGENNAAAALFAECWNRGKESTSSDMKLVEEAMEGLKKCQRFDSLLETSSKLCQGETCADASAALNLLEEGLLISPLSEALLELKAQTLFSVRRFDDVLQLCQQTLPAAEENVLGEQSHDLSMGKDSINLWRWRMRGKCLFHLGRLEESSSLLTKYEEATHRIFCDRAADFESMAGLLKNICELLQHKAAGNDSFQAGKHAEAVDHYTAALSCNGESRPYNAVCFCNRAAASQALGLIADAIADCSRAIVLDPNYPKAISRRATLHEMVRDYGQTCNDLERLIAFLERQEACSKSPKSTRAGSKNVQDLKQARDRLDRATKELKKGCAVDHYLILGLDVSCSANDIKKAYRKAALKHHPDKAGQVLVRGENVDDGSLWKEVGDEARRDAERLFKLIGEAYGILSDPTKRAQYDLENHMQRARNPTQSGYGSTDENCSPSPYEKSGRRNRERREWHSARYYRWQSGPDAAERDNYSERDSRDRSASKEGRNRDRKSDFDC